MADKRGNMDTLAGVGGLRCKYSYNRPQAVCVCVCVCARVGMWKEETEFTLVFLFVFFYTYSALVNVFFQIITFSLLRSSLTQTPFRAFGVQLKLVVSVDGFGAAPEYL